jgi:hypothetical protein
MGRPPIIMLLVFSNTTFPEPLQKRGSTVLPILQLLQLLLQSIPPNIGRETGVNPGWIVKQA